jgi:hypothetical protein
MFPVFDKLGGKEQALSIIGRCSGKRPNSEALRGWRRKRCVPAWAAVILLAECDTRGIAVKWPDDFVMREEPNAND